jgi:hypothetical protein
LTQNNLNQDSGVDMLLSCINNVVSLEDVPSDLIVLPEYSERSEIAMAEAIRPNAVVVAAVREGEWSKAIVQHLGRNRVRYLKVGTDGRTRGSQDHSQDTVYEWDDCCVGVLICMDVDAPTFRRAVVDRVQRSSARYKIICVPADMSGHWFQGDALPFPDNFKDLYVAVSNNEKTYGQHRCKSFITDLTGRKICLQRETEAIHFRL